MTLSSQNQIYQIDPIETALESYDLPQLVESRVLAINIESLSSMEVYGKKGLELKLLKRDDKWFDQNGILLAEAKVAKFIERISQLKSFSIMDNLTTEQREFMEKVVSTPLLTLKLITTQGLRNYLVGEVKENVPGMVIEKNKFFALSTEDKKSFILIDKEQLKVFSVRSAELK